MNKRDFNRVHFYSREDLAGSRELLKGESILKSEIKTSYNDINDILELYHLKKYFDNDLYLKNWTIEDLDNFKEKTNEYGNKVGQFFAGINEINAMVLYESVQLGYTQSFWEIVSSHSTFKRISKVTFRALLDIKPHLITEILIHKPLVDYYCAELKNFLLDYEKAAEILLTHYEAEKQNRDRQYFIPSKLTVVDKENIILKYLDSDVINLNYLALIQNVRNKAEFKISDRTKLKAKRLNKKETEKLFVNNSSIKYGVSVSFPDDTANIINAYFDDEHVIHYEYSLNFIKKNDTPYVLFQNFRDLFGFVDNQWRINLVSKKNQRVLFEELMGVRSENEYRTGTAFSLSEMTSGAQIYGYSRIVKGLNTTLEDILHLTFTAFFREKYGFAENARFLIPSATNSYFEKVRLLAPEFESILKQFKLYVEDGFIDFELLQISSVPTVISDIPSLNSNKYIYFNSDNKEMGYSSSLLFSDQSFLNYVEPFAEKNYKNFFRLALNENLNYNNFEQYQKQQIDFLIEKDFFKVTDNEILEIANIERLLILQDLYENEFASYHRYSLKLQNEVLRMVDEKILFFDSSLFSKSEQSYFNYFLNKKEFTNGLELRNSYLHGTQANPEEIQKHEYAYFSYLKLLVLVILKIEDDLQIALNIEK
ncbi:MULTISPECIES: hypothetical protein [Flavobacterium]|uniref:hypothetical protein n=1 Tax=Flavobacterium TaxID=237 RepID=UPI000F79D31A|nr:MULTISPECIES: hypothetical protein [Flavobacterium]MDP5200218.1 hypothetical protein [Flavobacterium sp. DG2-3]